MDASQIEKMKALALAAPSIRRWSERMPEHVRQLGTAASESPYKDAEIADLRAENDKLTQERDELRAEVERLNAARSADDAVRALNSDGVPLAFIEWWGDWSKSPSLTHESPERIAMDGWLACLNSSRTAAPTPGNTQQPVQKATPQQ